jgi:hypothetical protein
LIEFLVQGIFKIVWLVERRVVFFFFLMTRQAHKKSFSTLTTKLSDDNEKYFDVWQQKLSLLMKSKVQGARWSALWLLALTANRATHTTLLAHYEAWLAQLFLVIQVH